MLQTRRDPIRHAVWLAFALAGAVLAGCASKPPVAAGPQARLFAADLQGGAKDCTVPTPILVAGKETPVAMQMGNDGGWCAITVARDGRPFDAGLLTKPPAHGTVYIHSVGTRTRIDYTPDRGFAGNDSFAAALLPGRPVLNVDVTVKPR